MGVVLGGVLALWLGSSVLRGIADEQTVAISFQDEVEAAGPIECTELQPWLGEYGPWRYRCRFERVGDPGSSGYDTFRVTVGQDQACWTARYERSSGGLPAPRQREVKGCVTWLERANGYW